MPTCLCSLLCSNGWHLLQWLIRQLPTSTFPWRWSTGSQLCTSSSRSHLVWWQHGFSTAWGSDVLWVELYYFAEGVSPRNSSAPSTKMHTVNGSLAKCCRGGACYKLCPNSVIAVTSPLEVGSSGRSQNNVASLLAFSCFSCCCLSHLAETDPLSWLCEKLASIG